jgi:hypothetical protein
MTDEALLCEQGPDARLEEFFLLGSLSMKLDSDE